MEKLWHTGDIESVKTDLKVDWKIGLNSEEIEDRKKEYGINKLPAGRKLRWWQLLFRQFKNPLVAILLIAAVLTFLIEQFLDTSIIVLAVTVNVFIGFWQEYRSNTIFEKLHNLVKIVAQVKRNGSWQEIGAEYLVPGDIILIKAGMKVPADSRLLRHTGLEANEALLTGESLPVKKALKDLPEDTPLADRTNMIFTGTSIEQGEGEAIVVLTGAQTELGKIAELTVSVKETSTPLQERLSHLGKMISIFVVVSAVVILLAGIFENRNFVEMFTVAVAVAVAAIPEGMPAALSVVLAVASQKILSKKGLVKTLLGAETLGSTTVICTDKTGTLTEGIMKVEGLYECIDEKKAELALSLANEAVILGEGNIKGETTDKAKLEFFLEKGGNLEQTLKDFPRLALTPFDQELKYISSFHQLPNGSIKIFVSGAPENLLDLSDETKKEKEKITGAIEKLASSGFRLIGVAEKIIENKNLDTQDAEKLKNNVKNLTFLGIAAIRDPIRSDVKESMSKARLAGIRSIMITGDHLLTAQSIGKELGFGNSSGMIITGTDLDKMNEEELSKKAREVEIIARATPKHKMKIIAALKNMGEVVAMTGDGVNDAPALKAADVGISLGTGTDVTKEASDLVLLNNSFTTITEAIKQGRIAFDNIRKVVIFLLANSFTELILVLTSLILRIPLPITAVQILWANLVEDGLPNFALAFEPGEKDIMNRAPLKRKEPILDKAGLGLVFIVGILSDFLIVGIFLGLYYFSSYALAQIQTIIFVAVATDSLVYVFSIKSLKESVFRAEIFNNKYLIFAVIVGLVLIFATIYVPQLNKFLNTVPLGVFEISLVFGSSISRLLLIEAGKLWFRKKEILTLEPSRS